MGFVAGPNRDAEVIVADANLADWGAADRIGASLPYFEGTSDVRCDLSRPRAVLRAQ